MRDRIENELGLEPSFQALDDGGPKAIFGEKDPEKRYVVYDSEMEAVCRCESMDVAELIRDLLNEAAR